MAFDAMMEAFIEAANIPDNYLKLRSEMDWLKLYKAASDKNAIMCIEFCEESFHACRNASQYFLNLARKFTNLPFVQVRISGVNKWAIVRKSVGGVEYVPCIVVLSFTNDGAQRAKYEGEREIDLAIRKGSIVEVINEFKQRRELADCLEEFIAKEMIGLVVEKQKESERADENESQVQELKRQVTEIEEARVLEQEKREKLQRAKDERERVVVEERRLNRPIILDELNKVNDIESLPVSKLKDMFKRLHINIVGMTEKHELQAKLYSEFPELKSRQKNICTGYGIPEMPYTAPKETTPTHQKVIPDEYNIYGLSDQDIEMLPVPKLKKYISKYGLESEGPFSERSELIEAIKKKRDSPFVSGQPPSQGSSQSKGEINELNGKILELTGKLTETKILSICRLAHFEIVQCHKVPAYDKMCHHTIRCKKEGFPDPKKHYTLKGVFNYFQSMLDAHTIRIINEYETLSILQPHPNIIYHCALVYDKPTPQYAPSPNISLDNIALFSITESLPYSICAYLSKNHRNAAIKTKTYLEWMQQIISAFSYLFNNNIFLRSIKHDNILYDPEANLVKLTGFDSAINCQTMPFYTQLTSIGDLNSYLPPEILNAVPGPSNFLDYTAHYVWAAGALSYDLACNPSPFTSDRVDPSQYNESELPTLSRIFPYGILSRNNSSPMSPEYSSLVIRMLRFRPHDRPNLQTILNDIDAAMKVHDN